MSSVHSVALLYFSTLTHKWHDSRKKKRYLTKCMFLFYLQLVSERYLIQESKILSQICIRLYVKYSLLLSELIQLEFNWQFFFLNIEILNLLKTLLLGDELFHVERRTDVTKLIVAFRSFTNKPNKHLDDGYSSQLYLKLLASISHREKIFSVRKTNRLML
jgi:hypothetical protein